MGFQLPNPPTGAGPANAIPSVWQTYFARPGYSGNLTLQSSGISYTTTSGVGLYNPVMSGLNKITVIPRAPARATAAAAAAAGWNLAIAGDQNVCRMPVAAGGNGWQMLLLCGFDATMTVDPLNLEFVFGANSNTGQMPSAGQSVLNTVSNWIGVYKTLGDASIYFGYKNAGVVAATALHLLPVVVGPYQGFQIELACDPSTSAITYSVKEITGVGQLTEIAAGVTAGWGVPGLPIAPCCNSYKNVTAGVVEIWQGGVAVTPYWVGPLQT